MSEHLAAAAASRLESPPLPAPSPRQGVSYSRSVQAADDVEGCVGVLVDLQQRAGSEKHTGLCVEHRQRPPEAVTDKHINNTSQSLTPENTSHLPTFCSEWRISTVCCWPIERLHAFNGASCWLILSLKIKFKTN